MNGRFIELLPPERDRPLDAWLVHPQGAVRGGVLVCHEIFGLNTQIREVAERFAAEGYVALAVDLYSAGNRVRCMLSCLYGLMRHPLDHPAVRDLKAGLDLLAQVDGVDPKRIGVMGFCMGGGYAFALGCTDERVTAASVFYGDAPPSSALRGSCAVVGHFPSWDWTVLSAHRAREVFQAEGIEHDIQVYPRTFHGFFNDRMPIYNRDAAEDAWSRTLAFFEGRVG